MNIKKAVSAAERKKDYHAGPHGSFPIGSAGQHLAAAWDLAGHAANPDEVRAHILAFAHEHGLTDHLPQEAKDHMHGKSVQKAKQGDIQDLFHMAYKHESMEGDTHEKRRLVAFAHEHQLQHLLPDEAHNDMHDMNIPHNHDGVKNDENGYHTHTVVKAYDPISKHTGFIVKSWSNPEDVTSDVHFEGWMSTDAKDAEKDITEPEAFAVGLPGYFDRRAPLSLEHGLTTIPIGHIQKASIVRDGKIIKSFSHPSDPGEFEYFPSSGSGVWVLGAINEDPGKEAIRKGNIGGMSFIANASAKSTLPGGRYRYTEFDPVMESTIAAYPINSKAVIAVVKAFGLTPPEKETPTMTLEEIMAQAAAALEAKNQAEASQNVTKADLGSILGEFKTALLGEVSETVKKALPAPERGQGVGRVGTISTEDPFEADPAAYIIQKAQKGEEWNDLEKRIVGEVTLAGLLLGLRGE